MYLLSSVALADSKDYATVMSLIEDGRLKNLQLTDEWKFFLSKYARSISNYQALLSQFNRVVAEKEQLAKRNERINKQFLDVQSERAKLENQLKELKSIEASLIQRDLREDGSIP
jgi:hypothetical protein